MVGKWMTRKKKTNCLNAEPVGNNGRKVQEMTRKGERTTASTPSQRGMKVKWESK
jgi:hypothetical protein